jgi:hypothetical protein
LKITSIEAVPFTIPYRHPIVAASGVLDGAEQAEAAERRMAINVQ